MTFGVDARAVNFVAADFKVRLDPTAARRMHTVWDADAGERFAAATRGVGLQLPSALAMYRQTVSVFHEQADVDNEGTAGQFHALYNPARACTGRSFGASHANQPDVVYRRCDVVLRPTAVRSSAAFLEVDDRVFVTGTQIVDWGQDMVAACVPAG